MSTTACSVRGKPSDGGGIMQKVGPMKATIPMSSLLRPLSNGGNSSAVTGNGRTTSAGAANSLTLYSAMSPPMRLISPDHHSSGHRSPGAAIYFKVSKQSIADPTLMSSCMRRTASLDALYMKPSWKLAHQFQLQQQLQQQVSAFTILQLDKATQTDESSMVGGGVGVSGIVDANNPSGHFSPLSDYLNDSKVEKIVRQRLQRVQRAGENSVSSQTLSPSHTKFNSSPVTIPIRSCSSQRPMRSSVEGLNQEIEKLVLVPGQQHSCRPESSNFSRAIPEGHRAPLADILHCDTRSVNTQTPSRDHLSSDDSQSTSPDENVASSGGTEASPRINRFLARLPPDGCEKVCLKSTDIDQVSSSSSAAIFKPTVGFKLRPSLGSAFQPLQPIIMPVTVSGISSDYGQDATQPTTDV